MGDATMTSTVSYPAMSVPQLDFNQFGQRPEGPNRNQLGTMLVHAMKRFGFARIKGHGINLENVRRALQLTRDLFTQERSYLEQWVRPALAGERGIVLFGGEHARNIAQADLKEYISFGSSNEPYQPNIYPDNPPELKSIVQELYREGMQEASNIWDLLLIGSGVKGKHTSLTNLIAGSDSLLRLIHYPELTWEPPAGQQRSSEHEDISVFTILMPQTSKGLYIKSGGQKILIESDPDEIILNYGDTWELLTGGAHPSTTHGVENCDLSQPRCAAALFVHLPKAYPLNILPEFQGYQVERKIFGKWPLLPTTAGGFLEHRLKELGLLK